MHSYGAICGRRYGEGAWGPILPFPLFREVSVTWSVRLVRPEGCCLEEQVPPQALSAEHSQDVGTAIPDWGQREKTEQAPCIQARQLMGYPNNRLWGLWKDCDKGSVKWHRQARVKRRGFPYPHKNSSGEVKKVICMLMGCHGIAQVFAGVHAHPWCSVSVSWMETSVEQLWILLRWSPRLSCHTCVHYYPQNKDVGESR